MKKKKKQVKFNKPIQYTYEIELNILIINIKAVKKQ